MKVNTRDVAWAVAALILLGLIGLEWRRSYLIAEEIRQLSTAEAPLELVNVKLENAAFFLWFRYRKECEIDWPSLQPLGMNQRMLVTRTIQADTAKQAFEQLFGDGVEVLETPQGLQARARQKASPE